MILKMKPIDFIIVFRFLLKKYLNVTRNPVEFNQSTRLRVINEKLQEKKNLFLKLFSDFSTEIFKIKLLLEFKKLH